MNLKLAITIFLIVLFPKAHGQTLHVPEASGTIPGLYKSVNGSVGIGTNNPKDKLEIYNGSIMLSPGINTPSGSLGRLNFSPGAGYFAQVAAYMGCSYEGVDWWSGTALVFGTNPGPDITYMTPTVERMRIDRKGNVGIGTTNPERKLDVSGITRTTHTEFYEGTNWCGFIGRGGSYTGGWSSIPDALTLSYAGRDFAIGGWGTDGIWRGCSLFINANNGNIGMGTISPGNYKLNVAGKIRADEIVVNTTGADFVFEPGYKLRSLSELETFIRTNKHLPDIAPAKEMQENGVSAGEMQAKLLQKVEELTLYVIEKDKQLEEQNKKIDEQLKINQEQGRLLLELKKEIESMKTKMN